MRAATRRLAAVLGGALAITFGVASVSVAQPSPDEVKCQLGTSLAIGKFLTEKAKCLTKCEQAARKGAPATDCEPPFGGTTQSCVQRAEAKAQTLQQSKCTKDCPECYAGGDCAADSVTRVANAEAQVDVLAALVYCDDSGSGGLSKAEAKCQDTVAKTLSNFAAKKLLCYSKCRSSEAKGKVPAGDCAPPPADPKTASCIAKEESKAAFLIDKQCDPSVNPKAEKPGCYGTQTGAGWAGLVEDAVDMGQPGLYCGSPSAAFVR